MVEIFFGSMAFSMGLLAFTVGAWMTLSATNRDLRGAKLVGLIVTLLALICLVFTSYNLARIVFLQQMMQKAMASGMAHYKMDKHSGDKDRKGKHDRKHMMQQQEQPTAEPTEPQPADEDDKSD